MSTYKVIQDIEAEDKLVGPLTLRQFIYAAIAAVCLYLSFLAYTKHAAFMIVIFLPVAGATGFFAFPWGKDQPTEVWALAKIRFLLKPRRRVWDQSGTKDLVSVTAPKVVERVLTNGLNQAEVQSRLNALASTIDSRGWAIKNINVNSAAAMLPMPMSDRLIQPNSLPQEVSNVDVRASDDMLDEQANPIAQHFDSMINASSAAHRQQLIDEMREPLPAPNPVQDAAAGPQQTPADYWFMHQGPTATVPGQATFVDAPVVMPGAPQAQPVLAPQAAVPTPEELALVERLKAENESSMPKAAYGHMKILKTPEQLMAEAAAQRAAAAAVKPQVTPQKQAAIMNLANTDDQDVATLARRASKEVGQADDGEVVISLH
ncbi:MAG: PrgI family protein [Candidatus Saccharibacteria bacterium]